MSDLVALRQVIERIRGLGAPPNEEATKLQLVLPILRALGWDATDPSLVTPEYPVDARRSGAVDLALLGGRRHPVALIEVKAVGVRLDDHVDQVLGYAFKEGVDLCALTTGIIWWLYLPRERGQPQDRKFAEFNVQTDPMDQLLDDFGTYLSHAALVEHEAMERAREVLAARRESERLQAEIPRIWASMLSAPPQELIELIAARVSSSIGLRPSNDRISEFLVGVTSSVRSNRPVTQLGAPRNSDSGKPAGRAGPSKPDGFRLWGRQYPAKNWNDVWYGVAEALYDRHPERFEDMVGSPRGKRSYVELDHQALSSPFYRIHGSQYWVGGHGSASALRSRCINLLELFGYANSDIEFFYANH